MAGKKEGVGLGEKYEAIPHSSDAPSGGGLTEKSHLVSQRVCEAEIEFRASGRHVSKASILPILHNVFMGMGAETRRGGGRRSRGDFDFLSWGK